MTNSPSQTGEVFTHPIHPEQYRHQTALRALLVFTLPGAALFAALNFHLGAHILVLLDIVLLLVSLSLLLAVRKIPTYAAALVYLMVLFSSIAATLARSDIHPGADMWIAVIPVLSYLLLGIRGGPWVTLMTLAASMGAYFIGAETRPNRLEALTLAHVLTPTLGLFLACHFSARGRTRSQEEMLQRIYQDPLTKLWTREKLVMELELEQQRILRTAQPLSLLLIDLDYFKRINDQYGHDAGDAALVFFSDLLRQRLRETDLPCRIGGEEFAVLLPYTNAAGALAIAEHLRQTLEQTVFEYGGGKIHMTLSAGVVELGPDGEDWPHLYRTADERLYACKEQGRNCVLGELS